MKSVPIVSYFVEELTIISSCKIPDCNIDTAAISQSGICVFNESFVDLLTDGELSFVLAHEALHWGLGFFDRIQGRDLFLSNIAHDYVVNAILKTVGNPIVMPKTVLYCESFCNKSFEQVYEILRLNATITFSIPGIKLSGTGAGIASYDCTNSNAIDVAFDKLFDDHSLDSESENVDIVTKSHRALWSDEPDTTGNPRYADGENRRQLALSKTMDALGESDGRGALSEFFYAYQIIKSILSPSPRLIDEIPRMIGRYGSRSQPSKRRRNRRNRFDGTHLPYSGLRPAKSMLYLLIDTSGSMWSDETAFKTALGLIKRLVLDQQMELIVVQGDTMVQSVDSGLDVVNQMISGEVKIFGRGGSDFRPAFEFMVNHAKLFNDGKLPVVAFTDGDIDVPEKITGVFSDILWVGSAPTQKYGRLCTL